MMVERFTIGEQIEEMLLISVVFGFLLGRQVLVNDMFVISFVKGKSNPSYTDGEH